MASRLLQLLNHLLVSYIFLYSFFFFFFSLRLFSFQASPQRITVFHFDIFFVSSTLTPTTCMCSLTTSINLLFGLPLRLLPGSSISSILLPMYPLSLLCTCPNHLNLSSFSSKPSCLRGPSNYLVPDPVHPCHP